MKTSVFTFNFCRANPTRWLSALLVLMAVFGLSSRAQAQANSSITGSSIIVDRGVTGGSAGNETYDGRDQTANPDFEGAQLGTFNVSDFNTTLILNGGTLNTTQTGPDDIRSAILFYEVTRADGSATNGIKQIALSGPSNTTGNKTFFANMANVDLLAGSGSGGRLAAGSYYVEVSFRANGLNTSANRSFSKNDPDGFTYRASFTVSGTRPAEAPTSTTWTGGKNDNWFDVANWTNGIPNSGKDATIPDFGTGSTVQYPNIYSDAVKPDTRTETVVRNNDGTTSTIVTITPGYDNTATGPNGASGPAMTRTLTMSGTSQAQRSITRLNVGVLKVYGDFNNQQDSFIQRENTTLVFAGANQTISGSASGLVNVDIDGGATKTLTTNFAIKAGGRLNFINGILSTDISNVNVSFVELAPAINANGASGRITNESETSYVRGYVKISEIARAGINQEFGNIGLSLLFAGNEPGVVTVTRNTAENYNSVSNGTNNQPTIRRLFGVRPADAQTTNGGLTATLTFRYLDNELTNLTPNSQSLEESRLALFVSNSAGDVFGQLGRDAFNTTTNTLVKNNVTTFATFSLSEFTAPLPVTLIAFDAKRVGTNALVTWETAAEINNKGYEIQVSSDGRSFRTVGFVPSANPNSTRFLSYRYEDTEANKTGIRYYRLRQVDLNGEAHYYKTKVLNFGGSNFAQNELVSFPNPFDSELNLTASTTVAGKGQLSVTDLTGRVVAQESVDLTAGTNTLTVPSAGSLRSGIYMVRLVTPSGKAKTVRISKN